MNEIIPIGSQVKVLKSPLLHEAWHNRVGMLVSINTEATNELIYGVVFEDNKEQTIYFFTDELEMIS